MADGHHLEIRYDVIFLPMGGPMLLKFGTLMQNNMPYVDMAEIETGSKIPLRWAFQTVSSYISAVD